MIKGQGASTRAFVWATRVTRLDQTRVARARSARARSARARSARGAGSINARRARLLFSQAFWPLFVQGLERSAQQTTRATAWRASNSMYPPRLRIWPEQDARASSAQGKGRRADRRSSFHFPGPALCEKN